MYGVNLRAATVCYDWFRKKMSSQAQSEVIFYSYLRLHQSTQRRILTKSYLLKLDKYILQLNKTRFYISGYDMLHVE